MEHTKKQLLNSIRKISFEEVVLAIENDKLLAVMEHPNPEKYRNQQIFVVNINNYAYLVPFIESDLYYRLITIIPSRKATKLYLR